MDKSGKSVGVRDGGRWEGEWDGCSSELMMQKIPQLERFPVLQDEFRAGSSDSPRISTGAGPGRAEPERTLTNLWTAWHCSAEARSGRAGTTAGGRGRHALSSGRDGHKLNHGKKSGAASEPKKK